MQQAAALRERSLSPVGVLHVTLARFISALRATPCSVLQQAPSLSRSDVQAKCGLSRCPSRCTGHLPQAPGSHPADPGGSSSLHVRAHHPGRRSVPARSRAGRPGCQGPRGHTTYVQTSVLAQPSGCAGRAS